MIGVPVMRRRNPFSIIAGGLFLLCGILVLTLRWGNPVIGGFLLLVGLCFLAVGLARPGMFGENPESTLCGLWADERSKQIGALGLSYAWLTGLLFMLALFWLDNLNVLVIGTQVVLALSIVVMVISARLYQMYLFRRGDL
jgi:dipeptide/tripeptide permease